ncbi:S8 family serine peptidase [Spirosoma montaniterrae]|uniref:Ig-like domain-containing protein n=1 Tax=Spirosoma montaniterrae TaxID=1178516 RepID=A0A1P9WUD1_9BACT|nr:S8 family serine peptidase [Spirosoma montaniterrae]AQG78969.1 hypothetical protein AWR27_06290 [Spirosoma montaniterrae]
MSAIFYRFLFVGCIAVVPAFGQLVDPDYVDGEVYIKVKALADPTQVKTSPVTNLAAELPSLIKFTNRFTFDRAEQSFYFATDAGLKRVYRLKIADAKRVDELIEEIRKDGDIEYIEKVPLMRVSLVPNDPATNTQYHLNTIKAYQAWDINQGNALIKIAICDDAVQTNHPDLQGNMLPGYDVANGDTDPNPPSTGLSHGTHVAGIAGAVTNNGVGIASLGFNKVKLIPVKSTTDASAGQTIITHAYEGVAWAAQNGANIINTSWGGGGYSQTAQNLANSVYNQGIIWIAAAGNDNVSTVSYPGAYSNVVAVVSTTSTDTRSGFSNYGTAADVCAPGSSIYSTVPFNTYASYSGTSMACPLTASLFGYIWSINPALTPAQLITLIKNTCDNIDAQNPGLTGLLGSGRINALRAVQQACPTIPAVNILPGGNTLVCAGTSLTLTATPVSGGTYQWRRDNVATGTNTNTLVVSETGVYNVTVTTADGCSASATAVNVTVIPATLTISTNKPPVLCGIDSVRLTIPVTYAGLVEWRRNGLTISNARNSLVVREPGDYSVRLSAAGLSCTAVSNVLSVTAVMVDTQVTASGSPQLCPGQSLTLSVAPTAGANYQWRRSGAFVGTNANSLTVNETGAYSVSITSGLCTFSSTSIAVTVLPVSLVISATRPTTFCTGDSTLLTTTNVPGLAYTWLRNGAVVSGSSSATLVAKTNGQYVVTSAFSSCSVASTPVTVLIPSFSVAITNTLNTSLACTGARLPLTATVIPAAGYQWFRNNATVAGASTGSFTAVQPGNYRAVATTQGCSFSSSAVALQFLDVQTASPVTQSVSLCLSQPGVPVSSSLTATAPVCPASLTQTPVYAGGTVGYDAGQKSGSDPTVMVSNLPLLSNLRVSITWLKKRGGDQTTCGTATQTGNPYNNEVQFQLRSPQGTVITLVPAGLYGGGNAGMVTTVFQDGAATIASGATPASGMFSPAQPLATVYAENPNGTWTLLPFDNAMTDPLCISGFSLTAVSVASSSATVSWWDAIAGGNLLASGSAYTPVASTVTSQVVFAQALCSGLCPSVRVPVTLNQLTMRTLKTGDWTNPTTWSCNRVPTLADMVYIDAGHVVSLTDSQPQARQIIYQGGTLRFLTNGVVRLQQN